MEINIRNKDTLNVLKEPTRDISLAQSMDGMSKEAENIIVKIVDKTAAYAIKAMPIPDAFKDILNDVRKSFKTKDFKEIVKTVINSSIREGLEMLGISKSSVTDIIKLKDIMVKGGLVQGIKAGVDIVSNKFLKNNIVGEHVYNFFSKLKDNIFSNSFKEGLIRSFENVKKKSDDFLKKCKEWYSAYDIFDISQINEISNILKRKISDVTFDQVCIKENNIIQNMTELVNNKKGKLSSSQLQLCRTM